MRSAAVAHHLANAFAARTRRVAAFVGLVAMLVHVLAAGASPALADEARLYDEHVRPVLRARCYACHGVLKQKAKLRVDTVASMRGDKAGGVIVPGKPDDSELLLRITADKDDRMPPEGEPLEAHEIEAIRQWIAAGARAPVDDKAESDPRSHWSFQPIKRPTPPTHLAPHPIDALLAEGRERQGLRVQSTASRLVLLRRLSFDLIGLPPTQDEIDLALGDATDGWYAKAVNRLLADPRHGQRWARHWMDIWRYSDWWGLGKQLRNSQKHIWHWRDWIIESLNDDTPYDEMIRQMLAADELYPNDLSKLRATGYLARNYVLFNRDQWMDQTVEHVSKGLLGITMNCAKCHDHKYDPIDQADYYRMRAFFEPYHVRKDAVPGEVDLEKNSIPRAFDALLDPATYVYKRGRESDPDRTKKIQPGVPAVLAFKPLKIERVSLPLSAWKPGYRSWVIEAHLAAAKQSVDRAQAALEKAEQSLMAAKQEESRVLAAAANRPDARKATQDRPVDSVLLVDETFKTLDKKRWQLFGGKWSHQPGQLKQSMDGPKRSVLRLAAKPPRDFEAMVQVRILGGSKWRSVGISFDTVQSEPTQPVAANESGQNVYISAVSGGSKVQGSFAKAGKWQYPQQARRPLPIALNKDHTLRVRVRGNLVNAALNGQHVLAWRTSYPRRDGAIQLMAFDALAVFKRFTLAPLGKHVLLKEPADRSVKQPVALQTPQDAQVEVAGAERSLERANQDLAVARAEFLSVQRRAEAIRLQFTKKGSAGHSEARQAIVAAEKAKRSLGVAKAKRALLIASHQLATASAKDRAKLQQQRDKAASAVKAAEQLLISPIKPEATVTSFQGAKWSATRFGDSRKDDPTPAFPSSSTGRRSALADWITDPRNPLAARVAANHLWTRHMGQPLVSTVFEFGRNGKRPVQQRLLDWLASELIANDWSMKHLHRVIVTSQAYCMRSTTAQRDPEARRDPANQYWWRRPAIRMESQAVRDAVLAVAGELDSSMGGPPVPTSQQASSKRRSVYFFHSFNERNRFLTAFDEARVTDCYRREQSVVPQQALAMSNSALVLDAAPKIASRLTTDGDRDRAFVDRAFAMLLGIRAGDAERAASLEAIKAWRELPGGTPAKAREQFIWTLMNHNDFVTLR